MIMAAERLASFCLHFCFLPLWRLCQFRPFLRRQRDNFRFQSLRSQSSRFENSCFLIQHLSPKSSHLGFLLIQCHFSTLFKIKVFRFVDESDPYYGGHFFHNPLKPRIFYVITTGQSGACLAEACAKIDLLQIFSKSKNNRAFSNSHGWTGSSMKLRLMRANLFTHKEICPH